MVDGIFSIVALDAVKGGVIVKQKVRDRIDRLGQIRRLVLHPAEGMAAKHYFPFQIEAALEEVDKLLFFYQELLEGL